MDDKLYTMQRDAGADSAEYSHIRMVRSKLNRVRGELQETASGRFGAKIVPFHILRRRYIYDANPKFCDAILSIVKSKTCSELSAETLAKEFQTSKAPPPVVHLRDPMVRMLLDLMWVCSDDWRFNVDVRIWLGSVGSAGSAFQPVGLHFTGVRAELCLPAGIRGVYEG